MSVNLFTSTEASKLANSLSNFSKTKDMGKVVWYLFVSNVTAYNLQYKEDAIIDFEEFEKCDETYDNIQDAIDKFYSLHYNAFSNAGNSFYPPSIQSDIDWFLDVAKDSSWKIRNKFSTGHWQKI